MDHNRTNVRIAADSRTILLAMRPVLLAMHLKSASLLKTPCSDFSPMCVSEDSATYTLNLVADLRTTLPIPPITCAVAWSTPYHEVVGL